MTSARLSLSWKDHSSALSTVCKSLLENNFLVDCTIAADGQSIKAHRLILSACSPYFQMLFGEESEKHPIVFLKDVSFDTLKAVVDFIYHGETEISEGNLDAFLGLAASLQIKGLNDSSKKNGKPISCGATGNIPHSSSNYSNDVLEIPNTSASHEENQENFVLQHDGYHSGNVVPSTSFPFQESSDTLDMEAKPSVIQSPHTQTSILPDESTFNAEERMEPEPLHEVLLVPKLEQLDEGESDDFVQEIFEEDSNTLGEENAPAFGAQRLNQFADIAASCSESGSVVPGTLTMPQMAEATDAQGADIATTQRPPRGLRRLQQTNRWCHLCHKTFSTTSYLKMHLRTHTGERPFECSVCDAAFAQKGNLKNHLRTHTGERPFRCDVCSASFTCASTLKVHTRIHTGERPYRCDVCGETFIKSWNLKVHWCKKASSGSRNFD